MLSKIKNKHIALLGVVGIVLELIAFVVSLLLSWFDGYNMSALIIIGRAIQIPFFLICLIKYKAWNFTKIGFIITIACSITSILLSITHNGGVYDWSWLLFFISILLAKPQNKPVRVILIVNIVLFPIWYLTLKQFNNMYIRMGSYTFILFIALIGLILMYRTQVKTNATDKLTRN